MTNEDSPTVTKTTRKASLTLFGWQISIGRVEERGGLEVIERELED